MKEKELLKLLEDSGVLARFPGGTCFLTMSAFAPWVRRKFEELHPGQYTFHTKNAFAFHKKKWKMETSHLSGGAEKHQSYRAIVAMGKEVLPYIFDSLNREPDWWFTALMEITGEDPTTSDQWGDLASMRREWLRWGLEHGYIARGVSYE